MVDWQLMRYCSPAIDLLYNLFGITDKEFRARYYDKLIETYYSSLSDTIRRLGSDPDKLFTYADLQSELRQFGDFTLLSAPLLTRARVADADDVCDLDEYAAAIDKGEKADIFRPFVGDTMATFKKLLNDAIHDIHEYGYIGLK